MTLAELDRAVRAKLSEKRVLDFSAAELHRCLGGTFMLNKCMDSIRRQIENGLIIESIYAEFGREYPSLPRPSGPFPWASEEELEALYAEQAGEYPYA